MVHNGGRSFIQVGASEVLEIDILKIHCSFLEGQHREEGSAMALD